jgi:hypothetical protein
MNSSPRPEQSESDSNLSHSRKEPVDRWPGAGEFIGADHFSSGSLTFVVLVPIRLVQPERRSAVTGPLPRRSRPAHRPRSTTRTRPACPRPTGNPTAGTPAQAHRESRRTSSSASTNVTTRPGARSFTAPSSPASTPKTSRNTRTTWGQISLPPQTPNKPMGPNQMPNRGQTDLPKSTLYGHLTTRLSDLSPRCQTRRLTDLKLLCGWGQLQQFWAELPPVVRTSCLR